MLNVKRTALKKYERLLFKHGGDTPVGFLMFSRLTVSLELIGVAPHGDLPSLPLQHLVPDNNHR